MEGPFGAGFKAGEVKVMRRGSKPSSLADIVKKGLVVLLVYGGHLRKTFVKEATLAQTRSMVGINKTWGPGVRPYGNRPISTKFSLRGFPSLFD